MLPVESTAYRDKDQDPFIFVPSPNADVHSRPVYPYSVIPGGARSGSELAARIAQDAVVAKHFSGFDTSRSRIVRAPREKFVYVAYRIDNNVFWTKKKLLIQRGEELITDGTAYARTRCGNRISDSAVLPTSSLEPSVDQLNAVFPPSLPLLPNAAAPPAANLGPPASPPPVLTADSRTTAAPIGAPPVAVFSGGTSRTRGAPTTDPILPRSSEHASPRPASSDSPVPEPGGIWLAGSGAALVVVLLWKNRRKV
jgi:hypothetical protein